jgi:hypothetical protein
MSLVNHKTRPSPPRELEAFPVEETLDEASKIDGSHDPFPEDHLQRKSPAAHFGSQQIGSVVIPFELQKSINLLIAGNSSPEGCTLYTEVMTQNRTNNNCTVMPNDFFMMTKDK